MDLQLCKKMLLVYFVKVMVLDEENDKRISSTKSFIDEILKRLCNYKGVETIEGI